MMIASVGRGVMRTYVRPNAAMVPDRHAATIARHSARAGLAGNRSPAARCSAAAASHRAASQGSPRVRTSSFATTASAPRGHGAPVRISTHCPSTSLAWPDRTGRRPRPRSVCFAGIGQTDGETVHHRPRKRRIIAIGRDVLRQHQSASVGQGDVRPVGNGVAMRITSSKASSGLIIVQRDPPSCPGLRAY